MWTFYTFRAHSNIEDMVIPPKANANGVGVGDIQLKQQPEVIDNSINREFTHFTRNASILCLTHYISTSLHVFIIYNEIVMFHSLYNLLL